MEDNIMVKGKELKEILTCISDVIDENKLYLSELDAAIGDGDHGLNLHKGFKAITEKIKDIKFTEKRVFICNIKRARNQQCL